MSATVGQDWRDKTLRELVVMYHTRLLYDWDHTSNIVGKIHNSNSRKGCTKKTNFFHPYRRQDDRLAITSSTIHQLKLLAEV